MAACRASLLTLVGCAPSDARPRPNLRAGAARPGARGRADPGTGAARRPGQDGAPALPAEAQASTSSSATSCRGLWKATGLTSRPQHQPRGPALADRLVPAQDLRPGAGAGRRASATDARRAYLAQQLVNALAPAAIYALLATGYALIYGITGRINLAFGEFTTVGAFAALSGVLLAASGLGAGSLVMAAAGLGLRRRHRRRARGCLLRADLRPAATARFPGAADRDHRPGDRAGRGAAPAEPARASAGCSRSSPSRWRWRYQTGASLCSASASCCWPSGAGHGRRGRAHLAPDRFGRAFRACADDPAAAALVGVDVDRTIALTCVLGSTLAAVAGFVIATHYGIVGFAMGALWGFKALTAAVVGGIGSVSGAAHGRRADRAAGEPVGRLSARRLPRGRRVRAAGADAGAAAERPVRRPRRRHEPWLVANAPAGLTDGAFKQPGPRSSRPAPRSAEPPARAGSRPACRRPRPRLCPRPWPHRRP